MPNMDSDAARDRAPKEALPNETKILASAASLTQVPIQLQQRRRKTLLIRNRTSSRSKTYAHI